MKKAAIKKGNCMFNPQRNAQAYYEAFVSTSFKEQLPTIDINRGPFLNKSCLPNWLVRSIRGLKINPNM